MHASCGGTEGRRCCGCGLLCTAGACDDNALAIAVNTAYAQGVLSAAASGNEAQVSSMIIPACASKAVSVGAVYSKEGLAGSYEICTDNVPAADIVACFSNRWVCYSALHTQFWYVHAMVLHICKFGSVTAAQPYLQADICC
jgi:hypothetical protein